MAAVGTNFYVLEAEIWTYHLHLLTLIHYYEEHPGAIQKLQVFFKTTGTHSYDLFSFNTN